MNNSKLILNAFFLIYLCCCSFMMNGQIIDEANIYGISSNRIAFENSASQQMSLPNPFIDQDYQQLDLEYQVKLTYRNESLSSNPLVSWTYAFEGELTFQGANGTILGSLPVDLTLNNSGTQSLHISAGLYQSPGTDIPTTITLDLISVTDNSSNTIPNEISIALNILHHNRINENQIESIFSSINPIIDEARYEKTPFEDRIVGKSELALRWYHLSSADFYEVAYAFIDDLDEADYEIEEIFEQAIIVETEKNWYDLDISYPKGTLYIAVRPVGIGTTEGSYIYPSWDYDNNLIIDIDYDNTFKPHEDLLNWGFQNSFAEEGKFKKVITYYDRSLRNQQNITYLNDEDVALVAESDYDREGRPTISILPAPNQLDATNLYYQPNFNKDLNGGDFDFSNHDKLVAESLNPMHGAGKYFGSNNDQSSIHNNLIPHSGGININGDEEVFPFVQTKYLPDNTGRIAIQGGVGADYQIGSGHETKYYYANPSATELGRLFGNDIGKAEHYKKTYTTDPNGQTSVSYLDMKGNVIATALVGESPTNVVPLKEGEVPLYDEDAPPITHALTTNHIVTQDIIISSNSFVKTTPATSNLSIDLNYSILPLLSNVTFEHNYIYQPIDEDDAPVLGDTEIFDFCYTCPYELKITITDPCGEESPPIIYKIPEDIQLMSDEFAIDLASGTTHSLFSDGNCTDGTRWFMPANNYLAVLPGTYLIEKTLKKREVPKEDLSTYIRSQIITASFDDFLELDYLPSLVDPYSCIYTCEQNCDYELNVTGNLIQSQYDDCINNCSNNDLTGLGHCGSLCLQLEEEFDIDVDFCRNNYCNFSSFTDLDIYNHGIGNCLEYCTELKLQIDTDNPGSGFTIEYCLDKLCPGVSQISSAKCENLKRHIIDQVVENTTDANLAIILKDYATAESYAWHGCLSIDNPLNIFDADGNHYLYGPYASDNSYLLIDYNVYTNDGAIQQALSSSIYVNNILPTPDGEADGSDNLYISFGPVPADITNLHELFNRNANDGKLYWQHQFYNAIITCHREYCHYENCLIGKSSEDYDLRLLELRNLEVAFSTFGVTPSIPNTTALNFQNLFLQITEEDPFYAESGDLDYITQAPCTISDPFGYIFGSSNPSIPSIVDNFDQILEPGFCANLDLQDCNLYDILNIISAHIDINQEYASYTPLQKEALKWNLFTGIYLHLKQQIRQKLYSSSCDDCAYLDIPNDEFILFPPVPIANIENFTQANTASETLGDEFTEDACEGRANSLIESFEANFPDIVAGLGWKNTEITPELKVYCESQCEPAEGSCLQSSNTTPMSVLTYNTLDDFPHCNAQGINYTGIKFNTGASEFSNFSSGPFSLAPATNFDLLHMTDLDEATDETCGLDLFSTGLLHNFIIPDIPAQYNEIPRPKLVIHNNNCDGSSTQHLGANVYYQPCNGIPTQIKCFSRTNIYGDIILNWELNGSQSINNGLMFIHVYSKTATIDDSFVFDFDLEHNYQVSELTKFDLNGQGVHYLHNRELKGIYNHVALLESSFAGQTNQCLEVPIDPVADILVYPYDNFIAEVWDCEEACGEIGDCLETILDEVIEYINETELPIRGSNISINRNTTCYSDLKLSIEYDQELIRWSVEVIGAIGVPAGESLILRFITEDGLTPTIISDPTNESYDNYKYKIIAKAFTNLDYRWIQDLSTSGLYVPPIKFLYKTKLTNANSCEVFFQTGHVLIENKPMNEELISAELCNTTIDLDVLSNECFMEQAEYKNKIKEELINQTVVTYVNQIEDIDCFESVDEKFTRTGPDEEYHFTLYYYDQLGNIVKTIPPEGVAVLDETEFDNGVLEDNTIVPLHKKVTTYEYNSFNQITQSTTHDAGISSFHYDDLQRLRFSRNAEQLQVSNNEFSYTLYDPLSRIIEVGEVKLPEGDDAEAILNGINNSVFPNESFDLRDRVKTYYSDESINPGFDFGISRNRVTASKRINGDTEDDDDNVSYYSYDIHGNVKTIQQKVGSYIAPVNMHYDYDLISGNVKELSYNPGNSDQFFHRYTYDADNRLKQSFFSMDGNLWDEQARYFYYLHGPLARVEYGENKVQGMDYVYTMQGWIKAGNENMDGFVGEPGMDGVNNSTNINRLMGEDAAAFTLSYNSTDYQPINNNLVIGSSFLPLMNTQSNPIYGVLDNGFYNGNIAAMGTRFHSQTNIEAGASAYQYDQLHRIKSSEQFGNTNNQWINQGMHYASNYNYDGDGNLLHLNRYNATGDHMDELTYGYLANNLPFSNRLQSVSDAALITTPDQFQGTSSYVYDEIGNLTTGDDGTTIEWDVYNKISSINAPDSNGPDLSTTYTYDPSGNRVIEENENGIDIYIRDAQGNCLAIYNQVNNSAVQREIHTYGSSRLGNIRVNRPNVGAIFNTNSIDYNQRQYEISNHLGNVLSTFSGRKLGEDSNSDGEVDTYIPEIITANDYYPFGLEKDDRKYANSSLSSGYRFGFNGKEKDQNGEFGSLTHYDYGFRIYNPSIAKFLSVDPLTSDYPMLTPYQFASNRPIDGIDIDGLEWGKPAKYAIVKAITKVAKEGIENRIQKSLAGYSKKKWAKQFASDAFDALDMLSSSWWENAIELIPAGVGDAYALGTTGYKGYKVYQKLERINARIDAVAGNIKGASTVLRKSLGKVKKGFEAHHIIPVQLLKENAVVQDAVAAGFKFNDEVNGIAVKAYRKGNDGVHANHPKYTDQITDRLKTWVDDNPDYTPEQAKDYLNTLTGKLKKVIEQKSVTGGKKLNEINLFDVNRA